MPEPEDLSIYRTLLDATRAIPWRIDWASGRFTYIGPQVQRVLGWPRDSWVTIQDWVDRIHPADRDRVHGFCISQSEAGQDHEADYRSLKRDGGYVWLRDVVHVLRHDDGSVDALIGFMTEIGERIDPAATALPTAERKVRIATRQFAFTPAEERTAIYLAQGFPVKRIAQIVGVSVTTVRSQVQSVMRKTGTQRQIELLAVLLSMHP